ncbi:MAG TPA: hypothetical protein VEN81_10010, partial [Planctomycetota bacterium]|nr:hypothetical protein [Planctomycetota bacterium]
MINSPAGLARPVPAGGWTPSEAPQHATSRFRRACIQFRDLFRMKAHFGWVQFLLQRGGDVFGPVSRLAQSVYARLGRQSDLRSEAFDRLHHTDTFVRRWVRCGGDSGPEATWGYSPINQDF